MLSLDDIETIESGEAATDIDYYLAIQRAINSGSAWSYELADHDANLTRLLWIALNTDNYDNSDVQTGYFDVGHYVELRIGRWDKPFQVTGPLAAVAA